MNKNASSLVGLLGNSAKPILTRSGIDRRELKQAIPDMVNDIPNWARNCKEGDSFKCRKFKADKRSSSYARNLGDKLASRSTESTARRAMPSLAKDLGDTSGPRYTKFKAVVLDSILA